MDPVPARDTLGHHILRHQHGQHPGTRGLFSALLVQIAGACKRIGSECRRAGLGAHAGGTGTVGHHGDEVKRLDWVTDRLRLPMVAGVRSLNLANAVSVVVYEAWRQNGFES